MKWLTIALLLLISSLVYGVPEVTTTHTPETIYVGDHINLKITFTRPAGHLIALTQERFEPFELIKKTTDQKKSGDQIIYTFLLTLSIYETGDHVVPGLTFTEINGNEEETFSTKPYPLQIHSTLNSPTGQTDQQLNDIKTTVSVHEKSYLFIWIAIGFGVALLLALLYIWLRPRFKKAPRAVVEIKRPAHEIAYERLSKLISAQMIQGGKIKKYHFELSEIIREYLGNRFSFDAIELTSTELKEHLNRKLELDRTHRPLIDNFLDDTDLVKFARYVPPHQAIEETTSAAFSIIDNTRLQGEGGQHV